MKLKEQLAVAERNGLVREVWQMPKECPCCGSEVTQAEGMVAIRCTFENCTDQILQRLEHAVSKNALDWQGLGPKQVAALCEAGYTTLSDLLEMDDAAISSVFKKAAATKFKKERERIKEVPWWRKLHAMGVEGIGKTVCQDIAARWTSLADASEDQKGLNDLLGDVRFHSLAQFVNENIDELCRLEEELGFKFESDNAEGPLSGKTFCITGTMVSGTRDQVSAMIESKGGTVKGTVTKKVQFLVNGPGAGNNKAAAANKHGTAIITEEQLYEMAGEEMEPDLGRLDSDREY